MDKFQQIKGVLSNLSSRRLGIVLLFLLTLTAYPQDDKIFTTSQEIFEGQITAKLERIVLSSGLDLKDNALLLTINSPKGENSDEVKFLTNIAKKVATSNDIRYYLSEGTQTSDTNIYRVYINANKIKTSYNGFKKNTFLGEKTIKRNLSADINVLITLPDGTPQINETISVNDNDVIPYDEYDRYESQQFDFTRGTPPKVGKFEELFFPIVLVAASAAAILAFFIIRTK